MVKRHIFTEKILVKHIFYVTLHTQKKQGTNNLIIGKENENFPGIKGKKSYSKRSISTITPVFIFWVFSAIIKNLLYEAKQPSRII